MGLKSCCRICPLLSFVFKTDFLVFYCDYIGKIDCFVRWRHDLAFYFGNFFDGCGRIKR